MNANTNTVQVYTKGNKRNVLSLARSNDSKNISIEKKERPTLTVTRSRISDDEAARRANGMTPESQHQFANSRKPRNNKLIVVRNGQSATAGNMTAERSEYNNAARHAVKENNRIPGLYGCNRWKSTKESQGNCVEFNIF